MFDETFFTAVAFFLFLILVWKPLGRFLATSLDARADRIEKELSDAIKLREEAQVMLSKYEKKYREIEAESSKILKDAQETANAMQAEAEISLKKAVEARIAAANAKIERAEEMAIQGVQRQVVDVALSAAKQILSDKMQDEADDSLINIALEDIERIVH